MCNHPLHSTEERDLGENQREGTVRVEIGGLPTLYRGTERRKGREEMGVLATLNAPFTEEWDLRNHSERRDEK